ncbi:hypothetical protein SDJN02_27838, partial [Cucurbita argyrosperma subsp. argyrosperma]
MERKRMWNRRNLGGGFRERGPLNQHLLISVLRFFAAFLVPLLPIVPRFDPGEKRKERDGLSLAFGIAGPSGRPARRAISSLCLSCEGSQPHG